MPARFLDKDSSVFCSRTPATTRRFVRDYRCSCCTRACRPYTSESVEDAILTKTLPWPVPSWGEFLDAKSPQFAEAAIPSGSYWQGYYRSYRQYQECGSNDFDRPAAEASSGKEADLRQTSPPVREWPPHHEGGQFSWHCRRGRAICRKIHAPRANKLSIRHSSSGGKTYVWRTPDAGPRAGAKFQLWLDAPLPESRILNPVH
jgi:hypothetical protein